MRQDSIRVLGAVLGIATLALRAHGQAHEVSPSPGAHPRLMLTVAEVAAARAKVNAPNTLSNFLYTQTLNNTFPTDLNGPTVLPSFREALDATQPMLALLAQNEPDREMWARSAINMSLKVIRTFDPPYPETDSGYPEWYGRFLYRFVALTYDATYDRMTPAERVEFQDEMLRIIALITSAGFERSPNNHSVVFGVGAALNAYALDNDDGIAAPRFIVDEPVVRTTTTPVGDLFKFRSGCSSVRAAAAAGSPAIWFEGVDFDVPWIGAKAGTNFNYGRAVVWRPGKGPPAGATYYLSYTFTPDFASWKDRTRLAFQRNLDHIWSDGPSAAGVFYGSWTMAWMLDTFEAIRRTTGFDFAQHPAVREAVLWHPTELIAPVSGATGILNANNRNDSNYNDLDNSTGAGAPTYWTWVQSRYPADPGNRDKVAYWLLQHSNRWWLPNWARTGFWREALWVNDAFSGPPPLAPAPPLTLPLSRFFSGHNLANFRTGPWDGPVNDWSLFSFVAGPPSLPEHLQADRGSFTFHTLGEDFAIDTGYAFDSTWASTRGHNYVLTSRPVFAAGTCNVLYNDESQDILGGAGIRSRVISAAYDAVDADLRKSYVNTADLPFVGSPACWPVGKADRAVVLVKRPGRAPFAIVSDSHDVDGTSRLATWQLHTGPGNTISINGKTARVTGNLTGATLDVKMEATAALTLSQELTAPPHPGVGQHPRLLARATASDARFFALLVPEKQSEPSPLAVTTTDGGSHVLGTVVGGGLTDTIVQNRTASVVTVAGLSTDGSLAVVRTNGSGTVVAWLVHNATFLSRSGSDLWRVNAPTATRGSAAYDGAALSVTADDATEFRAWAPGATGFEGPNGTQSAPGVAGALHWTGTHRLLDTSPPGADALTETFTSNVVGQWVDFPLHTKFNRVVSGEYCVQSTVYPSEFVSHTKRTYFPMRADQYQAPRGIFGDATQTGKFTVHAPATNTKVVIMGRVVDRALEGVPYVLPWPLVVDQDYVKVEIDVGSTGGVALKARKGGGAATDLTLWTGGTPVTAGQSYTYSLSAQGNTITFKLNGSQVFSVTDTTGTVSNAGYFQWQVAQNQHVHFDDVHVVLPGQTYACTTDAECDDGLFCTQDVCNATSHTCSHPPLQCPNYEPECLVPVCDEENNWCTTEPIDPPPPPWPCGMAWCMCA
jgi:hypothetical protein